MSAVAFLLCNYKHSVRLDRTNDVANFVNVFTTQPTYTLEPARPLQGE